MKAIMGVAAALVLAASTAIAQGPGEGVEAAKKDVEAVVAESGLEAALDSVAESTAPQVKDALDQLALALGAVAARVANDPELRVATVRAASGLVGVVQVMAENQADDLQRALRALADGLATLAAPTPTPQTPAAP